MVEFISLKQYLLLKDCTGQSIHDAHRAEEFVDKYMKAKNSFLNWGNNPPLGSKVRLLVPGHGGPAGIVRYFQGIDATDPRFFLLSSDEGGKKDRSLAEIVNWWNSFEVIETK